MNAKAKNDFEFSPNFLTTNGYNEMFTCQDAIYDSEYWDCYMFSSSDINKSCNTFTSDKCLKFYNDDIALTIPICKESENYSSIQSELKTRKDLYSSMCITDGDGNLCSFVTQFDYEKTIFNQTLINETCKSKKCTNGFIKNIDDTYKLLDQYYKDHEKYYEDNEKKEFLNFLKEKKEYFNKLKKELKAKECVSQNINDSSSFSQIKYSTFINILIILTSVIIWQM